MTTPDPEDTSRPEAPRPDSSRHAGLPTDVDAAFAAIVADWAAADAPRWPHDLTDDGPSSGVGTATPPEGHRALEDPTPGRPTGTTDDAVPPVTPRPRDAVADPGPAPAADDHFVPPEPPPLPRLGASSLLGLALLVLGVVLLAVPGLLGGPVGLGIVPGLLSMTAGLGWLVFGLRRPREDDGVDDGGVL